MSGDTQVPTDVHTTQLTPREEDARDEETPYFLPRPEPEDHSVQPMVEHVAQPESRDEHEHPQVTELRAMFPDFDAAVLHSVLESVNFNQERAIDVLLGMSDPEYVSTESPAAPPEHDLALDEQLARQLALEDQQRPPRASGQSWPRRSDLPYQPRQNAPHLHQQQPQGQGQEQGYVSGSERGDFQELQENLGRMVESGKRTFSSLVTKAKTKINEYNQQRNSNQQSANTSDTQSYPQWGNAPPAHLDRHTASQAYAQDYYSSQNPVTPDAEVHAQPSRWQYTSQAEEPRGYDVDSEQPIAPTPATVAAPSTTVNSNSRPTSPPATAARDSDASRPSGEVPRPPATSSGPPININAAKLGLLPKRPVSLLIPQQTPAARHDPDEDELEYVENPFEEERH